MDVAPLLSPRPARLPEVARQIEAACREHGFFYVTGHGVAPDLLARLTQACAAFFALPQAAKMEIAMAHGGPAWRGYFPVGAELTSGRPDLKEGLYFGAELGDDPDFTAEIPPLPGHAAAGGSRTGRQGESGHPRWDGQNLHAFTGTYGDYLLGKVSKVFPQLRREVLTEESP